MSCSADTRECSAGTTTGVASPVVPKEGWAVCLPSSLRLYFQAAGELGLLFRDFSAISKCQSPIC